MVSICKSALNRCFIYGIRVLCDKYPCSKRDSATNVIPVYYYRVVSCFFFLKWTSLWFCKMEKKEILVSDSIEFCGWENERRNQSGYYYLKWYQNSY